MHQPKILNIDRIIIIIITQEIKSLFHNEWWKSIFQIKENLYNLNRKNRKKHNSDQKHMDRIEEIPDLSFLKIDQTFNFKEILK